MAQFDVYRNSGRQPSAVRFFLDLQSNRLSFASTRFVAPLVVRVATRGNLSWLMPTIQVLDEVLVLDLFNLATLTLRQLGSPVASLTDENGRSRIGLALDAFLSQA